MDEFGLKTTFHRLSPWAVLLVASCTSLAGIEDPVPRPDEEDAGGVPSGGSSSSSGAAGDEGFAGSLDIDNIGLGGSDGLRGRGDGGNAGDALGGSAGDAGGGGVDSPPECQADDLRCDVYQPQHCAAGRWEDFGAPCPLACVDGACQSPPSCGPSNTAPCVDGVSCCETIWVPGGDYEMGKASSYEPDAHFPRHVSGFYLDRFEVTVGRFSVFKDLYRLPVQGAGRHPMFANSGWQEAWEALPHPDIEGKSIVPRTGEELLEQISTQCPEPGRTWGNVDTLLPANCVNWYVAFAFCAWDGGRLPTEAEWNYAAAHGDAARPYPWSVDENDTGFGPINAAFNTELAEPLLAPVAVGSFPAGRGGFFRYPGRGHDDLGGNVFEWTLDQWTDMPADSCTTDCYEPWTENDELRSARGGAFGSPYDEVRTGNRAWLAASTIDVYFGFRCARDINTHPE
jgi:formylglycine-generating enzyme required for sulfatase activity